MEVAYLYRDGVQIITGEVELGQGEDLTHTLREHTQTVVRQVQTLQLGKPEERTTWRTFSIYRVMQHCP